MELLKFVWAPYEVLGRVPSRIRIIALPVDAVF
jgi:hypothetical protein